MEVMLALYLLSGLLKGFLNFYAISTGIDITLLFAVLLSFASIARLARSKNLKVLRRISLPVFFLFGLFIVMIISLLYTSSESYSYTKTFLYSTIVLPIFFIFTASDFFNFRVFLRCFISGVLVLVFIYIPVSFSYYETWSLRLSDFVRMYLALAESVGLSFLILHFSKEVIYSQKVDFALKLLSFFFLLILGARGPLLFVLLILFINAFLLSRPKIKVKISLKILVLLGFIFISLVISFIMFSDILTVQLANSTYRFKIFVQSFFSSSSDESLNMRYKLLAQSIPAIFLDMQHFLLGTGIGSFGKEISGMDSRLHPHNIFIEVLFELGIIGLILFLAFFISLFSRIIIKYRYLTYFLALYLVLNIMKSSSLIEIRILLSFVALSTISSNRMLCKI